MPAFGSREQQNSLEELSEVPYSGPWGGVQSEAPLDRIEPYGLADILNMICRKGALSVRPGLSFLPAIPVAEPVLEFADFFDAFGVRHQMALTQTRLLLWNGTLNTWSDIPNVVPGTHLTGAPTQFFSAETVNYVFLFSQGVDKIQAYNLGANNWSVVSPNAPASRFLMELNLSLIAANNVEGGVLFPQRVRWTGPGDPTDWVSLNAGVQDLVNNLGPINGMVKIFQTGFIFQQFGITQMVPTGNGLAPFSFIPIASNNRGCIMPYSLASNGGEYACYVGNDNIYKFDGTEAISIGDMPMQGRVRVGARRRIFADLSVANPQTVYGYITTAISGHDFNAYWLHIPGVSTWIFNFDEQNWFRATWASQVSVMGRFYKAGGVRIQDLIGPIASQNWTPSSLNPISPLDGAAISFSNNSIGLLDFSQRSEMPWLATSGQLTFGDLRHQHNNKKIRVVIQDNGQVTFNLVLTGVVYPNPNAAKDVNGNPITTNNNQTGLTRVITMGNGSGQCISRIVEFSVPGQYLTWQVSGAAGAPLDLVEIAPIFDVGGEERGG